MYTVASAAEALDRIAPLKTQMDWDNSGLLVGDPSREITKILVALDATLSVIREAEALGAELVVTHHPIIFHPIKSLLAGTSPYEAASRGIAVYSAHTCYDMAAGGVNDALADALGLQNRVPLWEEHPGQEGGRTLGFAGNLPCPMSREEFSGWVEEALGQRPGFVRYLPDAGPEIIRRVAVCGGAGTDCLKDAKPLGCEAYITGDVRHHQYLEAAQMGLLLMDAGHFATENVAMPRLREQLAKALPGVEVLLASC